jgi:hypothetical protein
LTIFLGCLYTFFLIFAQTIKFYLPKWKRKWDRVVGWRDNSILIFQWIFCFQRNNERCFTEKSFHIHFIMHSQMHSMMKMGILSCIHNIWFNFCFHFFIFFIWELIFAKQHSISYIMWNKSKLNWILLFPTDVEARSHFTFEKSLGFYFTPLIDMLITVRQSWAVKRLNAIAIIILYELDWIYCTGM